MRKQVMQMMTKWFAMMLAVAAMVTVLSMSVQVSAAEIPTAEAAIAGEGGSTWTGAADVTPQILALQAVYPEGTLCTNESTYYYNPAAWSYYGMGCTAFAMQVSDTVYGENAPVSRLYGQTAADLQAGDLVRVGGIHTVLVVSVDADSITVCEGNYNRSIHWGRVIPKASLEGQISYVARRG